MAFSKTEKLENNNIILSFLKGLIISVIISFGLIILLAFSLKWFSLSDSVIVPLNLVIKILSSAIGTSVAIKNSSKGLLQGIIFGILYILLAFVSFSLFTKTFSFDSGFLLDMICTALAGGIVGIIKVNKK